MSSNCTQTRAVDSGVLLNCGADPAAPKTSGPAGLGDLEGTLAQLIGTAPSGQLLSRFVQSGCDTSLPIHFGHF